MDFSAFHVLIAAVVVAAAAMLATWVVRPHSMRQHSLVETYYPHLYYCIRVLLVMVALNFHLLNDLLDLPVVNDCQLFDCIMVVVVGAVYWLDSVCHCRYLNEHFVNLM